MTMTLFSTAIWSSNGELQWALWPSEGTMTFPEALWLRKCPVNHLMNKPVPLYDDFRFVYTPDPGGIPSPNSLCLVDFLEYQNRVGGGGRNWPAALQHAITVMFLLLTHDVKTLTLLDHFSAIMAPSLLFICMPLSSELKMFLGVSEKLSSVAPLSSILKTFQHCSGSFYEL